MSTITLPRAVVQQALEALESCQDGDYTTGDVLRQSFDEQAVSAAIVALWAALAQEQAEQTWVCPDSAEHRYAKPGHCEDCGKTLVLAQERAEPVQEPEPVDVGLLEYRGNSVAFIYQKMTAYRTGIDAAWDAFRAKGLHPDGKTSLADMIAKHAAPTQRKPLPQLAQSQCPHPEGHPSLRDAWLDGWEAAERAHGIGGSNG